MRQEVLHICMLARIAGWELDSFKSNVQHQYMIVYDKRQWMRMGEIKGSRRGWGKQPTSLACTPCTTQQLHPMSHQPFAAPSGQQRRFSWKALVLSMTALQGVASSWYQASSQRLKSKQIEIIQPDLSVGRVRW